MDFHRREPGRPAGGVKVRGRARDGARARNTHGCTCNKRNAEACTCARAACERDGAGRRLRTFARKS